MRIIAVGIMFVALGIFTRDMSSMSLGCDLVALIGSGWILYLSEGRASE